MNRYRAGQHVQVFVDVWDTARHKSVTVQRPGVIVGVWPGWGRYLVKLDGIEKQGDYDIMHYDLYSHYRWDDEAARLLYE